MTADPIFRQASAYIAVVQVTTETSLAVQCNVHVSSVRLQSSRILTT